MSSQLYGRDPDLISFQAPIQLTSYRSDAAVETDIVKNGSHLELDFTRWRAQPPRAQPWHDWRPDRSRPTVSLGRAQTDVARQGVGAALEDAQADLPE